MTITDLYEEIIASKKYNAAPEIPKYIIENLKHDFYSWQNDAFENLLIYENKPKKQYPTHLMFNMATGTGKTLLMAASILYYYQKGYRYFLFFVNQNNIIGKTESNFIDCYHNKYLFREKIIINDKTIKIQKVENFSNHPQGIEIKSTTIQKLYNDVHLSRENQITLDELNKRKIVMLADEAHHLNANTKKDAKNPNFTAQEELLKTEIKNNAKEIEKGWEHTIIDLILHKKRANQDNQNILLEFTATIPDTKEVVKKYSDKIIAKFGLKDFIKEGYTKEIMLISSSLDKKERIWQALLFNWYRHKIAIKNNIANFKPVILFRSKSILESEEDHQEFLDWISRSSTKDWKFLKNIIKQIHQSKEKKLFEMGGSRTGQVLEFIKKNKIEYSEIAEFIKNNFSARNVIITNSKSGTKTKEKTTEQQEKLLNNLEDKNNHIRAIFTVDRLTEGWDVLNLFDIVRLYQGQNAGGSTKKTPQATTKEKQLIGRGIRYCPFKYKETIKNKRKFDKDLAHEMRALEELYYYTYDEESRYISHLKEELKKEGYLDDNKQEVTFKFKKKFSGSEFYKTASLWYNTRETNPHLRKATLEDLGSLCLEYKIDGLDITEGDIDTEGKKITSTKKYSVERNIDKVEKHIFYKAVNIKAKQTNSLLRFEELSQKLEIKSMDELQDELKTFSFIIISNWKDYNNIPNKHKLAAVLKVLNKIFSEFAQNIHPKIGSEFKKGKLQDLIKPRVKSCANNKIKEGKIFYNDYKDSNWYVFDQFVGTSEEKELIQFIKGSISLLEPNYDVYLIRNEETYTIYNFKDAKRFQPDFILLLNSKKETQTNLQYQVFIEPKGNKFKDNDNTFTKSSEGWKQDFLLEITKRYKNTKILQAENSKYRLIGLPFFNKALLDNPKGLKNEEENFKKAFKKLLKSTK